MKIISFFLFVAAPVIVASTSMRWFWKIKYIKCLRTENRPALDKLDEEIVSFPSTKVTINQIRTMDGKKIGDKIIVLQHLKDIVEDTEDNIRITARLSIVFSAIIILFIASQQDDFSHFIEKLIKSYAAPVSTIGALLWQIASVALIRLQVRKYRSILPDEKKDELKANKTNDRPWLQTLFR